jgi:hypothetical protein
MDSDTPETRLLGTFEKHDEFVRLQEQFLSIDLWALPTPEDDLKDRMTLAALLRIVS